MKKNKLDIMVMTIEFVPDGSQLKIKDSGRHELTLDEIKDTFHDSIDLQFEDFEKKLEDSKREFDQGIIVMPFIKINYKKET